MINFLRKLRRKEMKGTRYLKYAVGEIFLVVIGILIALSINNWNLGRIGRIEEKKLLESIKVDFERIKATLEGLNDRRDEALFTFSRLIDVRNSNDFSNELHIDTLLAKIIFTPTYNGNTSSVAIVINSGKINLLGSDDLKSLLMSWPGKIENLIEREVDVKTVTYQEWIPFAQSYTSVNDWFKHFSYPGAPAKNRDSRVTKNYKGLFQDRNFENTITKLELLYIASRDRGNGLISSADEIIKTIEKELGT